VRADQETDDAAALAEALKRTGIRLVKDMHNTAWGKREFVIKDDQGHTLYFGESRWVANKAQQFSSPTKTMAASFCAF
jgi:uncharacterized glyoxalase superfamily protein PhnB